MNSPRRFFTRLIASTVLMATAAFAQSAQDRDGLEVQKSRAITLAQHARKVYYDAKMWDLSDLPAYVPQQQVSGTIRFWGNNYLLDSGLGQDWENEFRRFHPQARFDLTNLKSALIATAGLVSGLADVAANRHITFAEVESFERMFNYSPFGVTMATGAYDVNGWMAAFCIVVHKDNPLVQLTVEQLDGIYGTARDGGWDGTTWHTEAARGPEKNLRTWGQLGLTGEWADKPIHVYGLNLRYNNCDQFEREVFQGGDKWNENLREYANYAKPDGTLAISAQQLMNDVSNDRYAIGWTGIQNLTPTTKALAIAPRGGGAAVPLTIRTVRERSYPLSLDMFLYLNRKPGAPLDPKLKEFLRFVLSREGQAAIARDGKYLPLTAALVQRELKKHN